MHQWQTLVRKKFKIYLIFNNIKQQCKGQDLITAMGDFNAKVGKQRLENITVGCGLRFKNYSGKEVNRMV